MSKKTLAENKRGMTFDDIHTPLLQYLEKGGLTKEQAENMLKVFTHYAILQAFLHGMCRAGCVTHPKDTSCQTLTEVLELANRRGALQNVLDLAVEALPKADAPLPLEVSEKLQALYTGDLPQLAQDFEIPEPDVCQAISLLLQAAEKFAKSKGATPQVKRNKVVMVEEKK
jgi:hypothetical protein